MRKQIMVSHFMNAVGCTSEQATKILQSAQWHPDAALSLFFQEHAVGVGVSHPTHSHNPSSSGGSSLGSRMSYQCVPTNTPATPPSFPDTLSAFAKMKTSSPADASGILQEPAIVQCQTQASKSWMPSLVSICLPTRPHTDEFTRSDFFVIAAAPSSRTC